MSCVYINIPHGHYIGQVRPTGAQRWQTVTGNCKTAESALSKAVLKMAKMQRARALFIDASGRYKPYVSMEAKR